jgi:hypothetical protein
VGIRIGEITYPGSNTEPDNFSYIHLASPSDVRVLGANITGNSRAQLLNLIDDLELVAPEGVTLSRSY